nr:GNAT family protein [Micromonospora sp. DSM 115978]
MSSGISLAEKPTLVGAAVTLRPVRASDAVGLAAVHPETIRLTGTHRTHTVEVLERWYDSRGGLDDRLDLAIVEPERDEWLGEVVLTELDRDNMSCGFRILLAGPEVYDRGYGTEATRLMLGHAFENVGLHRIELEVYAFNPRARRVYEKVGFRYEGTRRQALRWDDEWIDAHLMAVLADEWAEHRGHPAV